MQVNYKELSLRTEKSLTMLLQDVMQRNKDIRYDQLVWQVKDCVMLEWVSKVHENKLWKKPTQVIVTFYESATGEPVDEGNEFKFEAAINPSPDDDIEKVTMLMRQSLNMLDNDLRNNHDLDKIEIKTIDIFAKMN